MVGISTGKIVTNIGSPGVTGKLTTWLLQKWLVKYF